MSFIAWAKSHCDFQTSQIDAGDIAPAALEVAGVRPAGMRIISSFHLGPHYELQMLCQALPWSQPYIQKGTDFQKICWPRCKISKLLEP